MTALQLTAAITLGLLLVAETVVPFFVEQRRDLERLVCHDLRNLVLGVLNALVISSGFAALLLVSDYWFVMRGYGLAPIIPGPRWVEWVVVLVLFDCWMYWWHRINHAVPFFWRFHRMHHSDPAMDASSAVRFHPGEILFSGLARLIVVPALGMLSPLLLVYESISLPIVLVQHANIRLPRWLDFGLFQSGLLVTPAMHRVHHSDLREETNSNYSSVLAIWDRLFGSLRVRKDIESIRYGLAEFRDERSQTLAGMLATPLVDADAQEEAKTPSGEA